MEIARGVDVAKPELGEVIWDEHGAAIVAHGTESLRLLHACDMIYDPLAQFLDIVDAYVCLRIEKRPRIDRFGPNYGRVDAGKIGIPYSNGAWVLRENEKKTRADRQRTEEMLRQFSPEEILSKIGTLIELPPQQHAHDERRRTGETGVSLNDFHAYLPMHNYIFAPSSDMWPASSVNSQIAPIQIGDKKIAANVWLDQNRSVQQMTWAPGELSVIKDRLIADGGWIEREGCAVFNHYKPPNLKHGDSRQAGPWVEHVQKVFGSDANHIIDWLAHRVQRPAEKINHALVFGGGQGIGKDTLLEPIKRAVGPWNVSEVSPQHMVGRFNGFLKSVI